MYLSRLTLNPRDRGARRDIGDCHALHRSLLRAFDDGIAGEGEGARSVAGLLYRLEAHPRMGVVTVLAQSAAAPAWERLPASYLAAPPEPPKPLPYDVLAEGRRLRFRLRANPTRRVMERTADPRDQGMAGKRVELRREADQLAWLARKGESGGFRLTAVRTRPETPAVDIRPDGRSTGNRDGRRLTFGGVTFEGELVVTDAAAFRRTLAAGIGSGKAYGYGLLSIAPV